MSATEVVERPAPTGQDDAEHIVHRPCGDLAKADGRPLIALCGVELPPDDPWVDDDGPACQDCERSGWCLMCGQGNVVRVRP